MIGLWLTEDPKRILVPMSYIAFSDSIKFWDPAPGHGLQDGGGGHAGLVMVIWGPAFCYLFQERQFKHTMRLFALVDFKKTET